MTIEPINDNNVESVWNLYQDTVADCDRIPFEVFRSKSLGDPDFDPALMLVAVESGVPVAFMLAACRTQEGSPIGWLKAWGTHRNHQNQGIAKTLYQTVEDRFRELGAVKVGAGQAKPNYITPGIDANSYTTAIAFLLRRGFNQRGINYNMDVPLAGRSFECSELERRLAERGITARRVSKDDERFHAWMEKHWGYSWVYQAGTSARMDPPAVFIAEQNDEIVGFAAYDAVRPGWFGPMGTLESMRGTGIGSVLLMKCLDSMRDLGYKTCHIGAVGPLYFYAKVVDARVSRIFWVLEKPLV